MTATTIGDIVHVSELATDLDFVSDSQDVQAIKEFWAMEADDYDSFFVRIGDGEYQEVWGIEGIVPRNDKQATRLV